MSTARRMAAVGGLRRGARVSCGQALKPWTLIDDTNLVLALDARFGVAIATGVNPWSDQSRQMNNHSNPTTSKQPAYVADSGKLGVEFDGVDDWLENRAFSGVTAGDEFTYFIVCRFKTQGQTDWALSNSDVLDTNSQGMQFLQNAAAGGRFEFQHGGGGSTQVGVEIPSDTNRHVFTINGQTTKTEMFRDGSSVAVDTSPTITLRDIVHSVLGARPDKTVPAEYVLHSLLIYNTLLSAGDRSTVENALGAVWGVTI